MSVSLLPCRRERYGHLRFNPDSGRFVLDGWELHCGDGFQVLAGTTWVNVRIEMAGDDWVLIGLNTSTLNGLEARSHE